MADISANLQLNFASWDAGTPLEVDVDDKDSVSIPVTVQFHTLSFVSLHHLIYGFSTWRGGNAPKIKVLGMMAPGRKRVKVFCSRADAPSIRIHVDNGARKVSYLDTFPMYTTSSFDVSFAQRVVTMKVNHAKFVTRVSEPITESINWSGDVRHRLKYYYDQPAITILYQTSFVDKSGNAIPAPIYNQERGEFYTSTEAIGALVVQYSPEYSVYEIIYDNAETIVSSDMFSRMQNMWMFGSINNSEIVPPVQLIVLSDKKSAVATFKRVFWPEKPESNYDSTRSHEEDFDFEKYNSEAEDGDSEPIEDLLEELLDKNEEDTDSSITNLVEIAGTRQTVTKRVTNEDDPDLYIDFKEIIYFEASDSRTGKTFKIRMLNE